MLPIILGILFFACTFGPRFFKLENFGFGFIDLGLYSQFLNDIHEGFINPYIPTLGKTFFALRAEPFLVLFWPISFLTTHPAVFLFLDEMAIIGAAAVCANFTWRKTKTSEIAIAVFFAVLFSPLAMEALHGAGRVELWAQPFLALLLTEHYSRRRPLFMILWFSLLCLVNLNFCFLGVLIVPYVLFTQTQRWNVQRRIETALPIALVAFISLGLLHYLQGSIQFNINQFWPIYKFQLLKWLVCFWFLPLLVPDALLVAMVLLTLNLYGFNSDTSLVVPVGVIATIVFFERLKLFNALSLRVLSIAMVASCVYFNLMSSDPLFRFWDETRWSISDENKKVHEIIGHIPALDTVAVSDVFTPALANRLSLQTLSSVNWGGNELPRYVLARNEAFSDPRYKENEVNLKTGTRLFLRFK